jgi:hypothetical protein
MCRAARICGSAADDQLSSEHDWSKSKPGSTSPSGSGADSSRSNSAGPPFGLPSGEAREGISRHSRILRATPGSVIADRIRIRPPHARQCSASTSKTRCKRSAQAVRPNDTSYQSVNPTSGQFGYVTEDEMLTNRRGAVPFSMHRYRLNGSIDWRFAKRSRMGMSFQHEISQRENRARHEVRDERMRVYASTALIPYTQLRLSYSYLRQRGSNYSASRDARYYDAPGPGRPPRTGGPTRSLLNFRQFDIGSQGMHNVAFRAHWLIGPRVDLSLAARYEIRDFRASYGGTDSRVAEISLDTSIQISPRLTGHGFASFDWMDRRMASINGAIALGQSSDFRAGSARFPLSNRWTWDSFSRGLPVGAGLTAQPHKSLELRADYRFQGSHEVVDDTDFDRTGGALTPLSVPADAPSGFPALR